MIKVKICGITDDVGALLAAENGADYLGFIFIENTPRYIGNKKDVVKKTALKYGEKIKIVGLFKDRKTEEIIQDIVYCGLNSVQLCGDESPEYCSSIKTILKNDHNVDIEIMKVFKVKDTILSISGKTLEDYKEIDMFVFDTFHPDMDGGTGKKFNLQVLLDKKDDIKKPFFIAGGLNPGNVKEVIEKVDPYGVDVSSGIEETKGKKDEKLLKEFIDNAKN